MTYSVNEQQLKASENLNKNILNYITDQQKKQENLKQSLTKTYQFLEDLQSYLYKIGGNTAESLYHEVRKVRQEVEQTLSTAIKQDPLSPFEAMFKSGALVFSPQELQQLDNADNLKENFNKLFEAELVDRPREIGTTYKYPIIPITVRDTLKKQGFKQGRSTSHYIKDYKGYRIELREQNGRKSIMVFLYRDKDLLKQAKAYSEEQLLSAISDMEKQIDTMRTDPSGRVEVNIDDTFDWNFMTEGVGEASDAVYKNIADKILSYAKSDIGNLKKTTSIEDYIDNLSEEGIWDIPAETAEFTAEDVYNISQQEAEAFIKLLLSKTNLKSELEKLSSETLTNHEKIKRAFETNYQKIKRTKF